MAVLLIAPPGVVSHQPEIKIVSRKRVSPAVRRKIIQHFEEMRSQFSSLRAFTEVESKWLGRKGILCTPNAIRMLLIRHRSQPTRQFKYEQIIAIFRSVNRRQPPGERGWFDCGDFPMCKTAGNFRTSIAELRSYYGLMIQRRPASFKAKATRGWPFEYRLIESTADREEAI